MDGIIAFFVQQGLLGVLLVVLAIGGFREWYVFGPVYRAMVTDRDFWRSTALEGLTAAVKGATVAERATERLGKRGQ